MGGSSSAPERIPEQEEAGDSPLVFASDALEDIVGPEPQISREEHERHLRDTQNRVHQVAGEAFQQGFQRGYHVGAAEAATVSGQEQERARRLIEEHEASLAGSVEEQVADLSKRQFRAPFGEETCRAERNAAVDCYRGKHGAETLVCDPLVQAFSACSQATVERFVRTK